MYRTNVNKESEFKYFFLVLTTLFIFSVISGFNYEYLDNNFTIYSLFMGFLTAVTYMYQFEYKIEGRIKAIAFLKWILFFILSTIGLLILKMVINYLFSVFDPIPKGKISLNTLAIIRRESIFYYFFSIMITYQGYQLIKFYIKRFHDMNVSGEYFLAMQIPILHFYAGYKIYKQGKKSFGILVSLSFLLSYLIIPFLHGDKGANYYGFNPSLIKEYWKKRDEIWGSKFLSDEEKEKVVNELKLYYSEIELKSIEAFKKNELVRLAKGELDLYSSAIYGKENIDNEAVKQRIEKFYQKSIEEKLKEKYSITNWEQIRIVL